MDNFCDIILVVCGYLPELFSLTDGTVFWYVRWWC